MNFPGKEFWYDWNGANEWLFKQINGIRAGDFYDNVMIMLSQIADHRNFYYYMAGLALFAVVAYIFKKIRHSGGTPHFLAAWIGALLVLAAGYAVEGYVIHHTKEYFSYPRPYMLLAHDTRQLEPRPDDDNYHSFPSGHTAFITLMVVGLWPVLSKSMKWVGAALVIGVMWSRMVMGVHFPADVLISFMFFFPMMVILRSCMSFIIRNIRFK